jgi:hypothetical protein
MDRTCSTYGRALKCIYIFVGKPKGNRPLGNLGVDDRMILKRVLNEKDIRMCTELIWLRIGTSGGFC